MLSETWPCYKLTIAEAEMRTSMVKLGSEQISV